MHNAQKFVNKLKRRQFSDAEIIGEARMILAESGAIYDDPMGSQEFIDNVKSILTAKV
jgi:hypothetical protein